MQAIISPIQKRLPFLKDEGFRQSVTYFLAIAILFLALATADRLFIRFDSHRLHFYLMIGTILLLGMVNVFVLNRPRYTNLPEWMKGLWTMSANLLGAVIFLLASWQTDKAYYADLILPTLLFFALPWIFSTALKAWLAIPKLTYSPLKVYDLRDVLAEIDWAENKDLGIVWEFERLSEMLSEKAYLVRTHSPQAVMAIPLERLFKGLLSLHNNNLRPELPIDFVNKDGIFGWRFFAQKRFLFWKRWKPLDPQKTFRQNGVHFSAMPKKERKKLATLGKTISSKFRTTRIHIIRVENA